MYFCRCCYYIKLAHQQFAVVGEGEKEAGQKDTAGGDAITVTDWIVSSTVLLAIWNTFSLPLSSAAHPGLSHQTSGRSLSCPHIPSSQKPSVF